MSDGNWPRPLFCLTVAFAAGIVAERFSPPGTLSGWSLSGAASLLLLSLCVLLFDRLSNLRTVFLPLALFLGLGFLAARIATPILPTHPRLEPFFERPQTLFIAEVSSPADFYPGKIRLPLRLRAAFVDGKSVPVEAGILLTLDESRTTRGTWFPGDRLLVRLSLKRLHNFNNPGGYDYVKNQAEQGFFARAHLADDRLLIKLTPDAGSHPLSILHALRSRLDRFRQDALFWLQNHLKPDVASFYAALLLGYQHLLSDVWYDHLSRTGVTHLLSIGGLHLGLVSMLVFWGMRRLVRSCCPSLLHRTNDQHIALWPALLAATIYACVAGFTSAPVWRSMLMLTFCLVAASWYRSPDSFSVLAAAALVILVIDANSFWQISFQLTFACMFAIFSLYPRLERFHLSRLHPAFAMERLAGKLLHPFEEAFWVSIAVNVAVLPLTVYYFYGISLAAFVANILLVPFVGFLVLPPGLIALALFALNEHMALPVLQIGGWFLGMAQNMILWFSHFSWAYFWVGSIPVLWLLGCYGTLGLILAPWHWKKKAAGILTFLIALSGTTILRYAWTDEDAQRILKVTAIDVSQGTATLLQFPTGETMLVDGGGFYDEAFDMGRAVLAPFLWYSGVRKLDHVVLSHDHPDHRNGLRFILSHFDVGSFWESGIVGPAGNPGELAAVAARRGIPIGRIPEILDSLSIGPCRVVVLHPAPSYIKEKWNGKDLNNLSLVLQIDFGETHLILPGDIDQATGRLLFENHDLAGNVLFVAPHHGSERSNSAVVLDRLHPQAMVFSCGYDNLFGFPSPAVLEECRKRQIPVFRTDLQGAIQAVSDGKTWAVKPMRTAERTLKDADTR